MNLMNLSTQTPGELCALTDSLTSSIRWRMCDYEAILRAELEILTEPYSVVPLLSRRVARPSGSPGREN